MINHWVFWILFPKIFQIFKKKSNRLVFIDIVIHDTSCYEIISAEMPKTTPRIACPTCYTTRERGAIYSYKSLFKFQFLGK
jgi:hypothetical protein